MRSSLPSGKSATPPARCIHRPLRDTSSAEYRLLVSLASGISPERSEPRKRSLEVCASREPESRRSPALIPHTCAVSPTFRYGAFLFVVFALADLSSARVASCDRGHAPIRRKHRHYPTLIDPITTGRRLHGKSDAQAVTNAQTGLLQLFRGDCPRYFLQFFLRQQIPLLCSLPKPLNRLSFVCRDTFAI